MHLGSFFALRCSHALIDTGLFAPSCGFAALFLEEISKVQKNLTCLDYRIKFLLDNSEIDAL